jgi:uncharacterized protein YkwD
MRFLRQLVLGAVLGILIIVFLAKPDPIVEYAQNVLTYVKEYTGVEDDTLQQIRQEIFAEPLRNNGRNNSAALDPVLVIAITNQHRRNAGLPPLAEDKQLSLAAMNKVQDMFNRQYFEHVSPDGHGPGYLAEQVGYSYVIVGENLAMGMFESDADLVQAWMNSPGHRANILNERYLEIGVAVGIGEFNGERVWLAVQEFGKPYSSCPAINDALRVQIESNKTKVTTMSEDITSRKKELDQMAQNSSTNSAAYNKKVNEYNDLVSRYNDLVAHLKNDIDMYNEQVRAFNACAKD